MFKPKFLKEAQMLQKGVSKFLRYKRDLISQANLDEIKVLRDEFDAAVTAKDESACEAAAKKLTKKCEIAVPVYKSSGMRENIEVVFVAVVIAVGIRAYFLQPFKIPTGSMQPTLNGIIGYKSDEEPPGLIGKVWDFVKNGRNHVQLEIPEDGELIGLEEHTIAKFFTKTKLLFRDSSKDFSVYATKSALVQQLGLGETLDMRMNPSGTIYINDLWDGLESKYDPRRNPASQYRTYPIKKGLAAQGYIDTGDQVLVDKISYHFRAPERGEVIVFRTTGISGIEDEENFRQAEGSQHYIKRLVAVPGDEMEIRPPELLINGSVPTESGIKRVMDREEGSGYEGYQFSTQDLMMNKADLREPVEITYKGKVRRNEDVYFAMGDNTGSSRDSRMWGFVPEPNMVGPALLVYWPFTSHWGFID